MRPGGEAPDGLTSEAGPLHQLTALGRPSRAGRTRLRHNRRLGSYARGVAVATISIRFYESAAQVIPILFFALLFEVGLRRRGRDDSNPPPETSEVVIVLTVIFLLIGGEVAALRVLATESTTNVSAVLVIYALGLSLALIAARLIFDIARPDEGEAPRNWIERHWMMFGMGAGIVAVLIVAIPLAPLR
jgi:hypothetical protein